MDFRSTATTLKASGYPPRKADAKIAHDIVLKAIEDAGFHDKVTIKGGVVMSGITDAVRRATIDMDFDFLGYSLGDVSIRRFVQRLNRVAGCEIRIDGDIQELRQSEYRGKRVNLVLTDEAGHSIKTKVDIGVHGNKSIEQVDFRFKVISDNAGVVLLESRQDGTHQTKQYEIDFVINRGPRQIYIQSAYSIPTAEKREQETFSLRHTGDSFKKIVITNDPFQTRTYDDTCIAYIGLLDFLLDPKSLETL